MYVTIKTNERFKLSEKAKAKFMENLKKFFKENPEYGKKPIVRFDAAKSQPIPDWWDV